MLATGCRRLDDIPTRFETLSLLSAMAGLGAVICLAVQAGDAPGPDVHATMAASTRPYAAAESGRTCPDKRATLVNTYHIYDAARPFGGYKQSGWGREMGEEVLNAYQETKSVVVVL